MVDTPIPLPRADANIARERLTTNAKDVIKNKLMNKDYDKGFPASQSNSSGSSQKLGNISNDTNMRNVDRAPEKDSIEDIINKSKPDPSTFPVEVIVPPGTKSTRGNTITEKKYTAGLAIISPDHKVEDSPNASHVNESLGKSTAMMAVKTLTKRKSITDKNSRPLSGNMKSRYVYEDDISALKEGLKKLAALRENEKDKEITNNSETVSPNEKNKKPEKRGDLVTVNPKINDNQ